MSHTHFIAETDENNDVSAVWIKSAGHKSARVFNPLTDPFDPREAAYYAGAPEERIKQWILTQKQVAHRP